MQMEIAVMLSNPARSRRSEVHFSLDFVQAYCGSSGLAGVCISSLFVFSTLVFPKLPVRPALPFFLPISPKQFLAADIREFVHQLQK